MLSSRRKSLLLLILGIGLLVNPYAPGLHLGDGNVYQYEAATVTYEQPAGLQATDPETGRELHLRSVDDEIICEGPAIRRTCQFEYSVYKGTNVSSVGSSFGYAQYEFVYLNDTLYRPTTVERSGEWYMSLEQVTEPDPLRDIADSGVLSDSAHKAISTGTVMTYRELPEDNTLIRHDGQYYTLYTVGAKRYWGGGSTCSSGSDGFCSAADSKRWTDSLLTFGSWVIGVALVFFALRSRDPT